MTPERLQGIKDRDADYTEVIGTAKDRRELLGEIERLRSISTVEMMCENENVRHHIEEWEKRCLDAEAANERLTRELAEARIQEERLAKAERLLNLEELKNAKLREAMDIAKSALRHCDIRHKKCSCSKEAIEEIEAALQAAKEAGERSHSS